MKVVVLMGGRSTEREISLRTGRGIAQALRSLGHDVLAVDAANGRLLPAGDEERGALPAEQVKDLPAAAVTAVANTAALKEAEVVFLALHGGAGEDGTIQALLGDEPLPIVEITPQGGHYDYESKYTAGKSQYACPAELPEPLAARIRELGLRAAQALGCRGVARADFRLSPAGEPYCLEVNTIPGMTPTSLVPIAAGARGLSYDQLVARMLELAAGEWRRRHRRVREGAHET